MRHPKLMGPALGLLIAICGFSASAQKIEEQNLKVNVSELSSPLQQLKDLKPVTFKYDNAKFKHLNLSANTQYGFLASNVQPQFPGLVYEASKVYSAGKNSSKVAKYDEVNNEALIPILVAAIKEQQAQIELLKAELNQMKVNAK
ncbi:MAG: tail fiber domain-containing protein [Pedobacter sp.]|nr:MAG: tail fiber domain-containing protein [Pedobacter sp.]